MVKTASFYCKRLQNDGALNFVHFFLGHSVYGIILCLHAAKCVEVVEIVGLAYA